MKIGITGYGVIGRALARLFTRSDAHEVHIYDKYLDGYSTATSFAAVDRCDIVFIAVPTPVDAERGVCDVSIVTQIVQAVSAPICIKSTVPPGTTDGLIRQTGKRIAFSPEYAGEAAGHPWPEIGDCGFVILGGDHVACGRARRAFEIASHARLQYIETNARTAELVKYMENCFLATKVAFMNQFYDLARTADVDFNELRKLFLLDSRVGVSHTVVTAERGFGGKCLPKDVRSIIGWSRSRRGGAPFLEALLRYNEAVRTGPAYDVIPAGGCSPEVDSLGAGVD